MAASKGKVNWYGDEFMLVIQKASDELLTQLAFQGEALVKPEMPVDTGFMRNATYGMGPQGSHRSAAEADARGAAARDMAASPKLKRGDAAIHFAAYYTIYQEMAKGFIYRMLQRLKRVAGGTIQRAGRRHFG